MASIVDALIDVCNSEWAFFGHSFIKTDGTSLVGKKEYQDGAWQRIGDYWKNLGGPYKNLTGKDRGVPWSAAFISWCMREAGAGAGFPYSAGHATYINAAIRDANKPTATLVGKQLNGYKLKLGDLIGYWRGEKQITFDTALKIGWYESHTEIIVEIAGNRAFSMGGNVNHSVTKRQVKLGTNGELKDTSENWFVVIQNNL